MTDDALRAALRQVLNDYGVTEVDEDSFDGTVRATELVDDLARAALAAGPVAGAETWSEIVARHVADTSGGGVHRGPLPDESLTYPCVDCEQDWPCDVVLLSRWLVILPTTADYNAVCEDREMWRLLAGEAQAEAAEAAIRAAAPALGVERLATAMDEAFEYAATFMDDHEGFWRPFAAKVAREYAALAPEPKP